MVFFCIGGKWTTYRSMAKDAVDTAVESADLKPKNDSLTDGLLLEGAHGWTSTAFIRLAQDFGLESEVRNGITFFSQNIEVLLQTHLYQSWLDNKTTNGGQHIPAICYSSSKISFISISTLRNKQLCN